MPTKTLYLTLGGTIEPGAIALLSTTLRDVGCSVRQEHGRLRVEGPAEIVQDMAQLLIDIGAEEITGQADA